jgi:hypothetical protein
MKFFAQCLGEVVFLGALVFCAHPVRIRAQTHARAANSRETNPIAVRILRDPVMVASSCWLLERDPIHPEGPGRWLQVPIRETGDAIPFDGDSADLALGVVADHARPIIRGGDQLMIEENSKLVDARLQAVALQSASTGEIFAVRLRSTGKLVRAVAMAPGRAEFAQGTGVRP